MKMDNDRSALHKRLAQHRKLTRSPSQMGTYVQRQAITNGGTHCEAPTMACFGNRAGRVRCGSSVNPITAFSIVVFL
jgi:hypothetical protein